MDWTKRHLAERDLQAAQVALDHTLFERGSFPLGSPADAERRREVEHLRREIRHLRETLRRD